MQMLLLNLQIHLWFDHLQIWNIHSTDCQVFETCQMYETSLLFESRKIQMRNFKLT